jgi:hypothetical protein
MFQTSTLNKLITFRFFEDDSGYGYEMRHNGDYFIRQTGFSCEEEAQESARCKDRFYCRKLVGAE